MHVFFFEVPRIEEVQDPGSSPGREEVGRRTLRDYGGFLLSFFIGRGFEKFTRQFLVSVKPITQKPPDTPGILESTSPREFYTFDEAILQRTISEKKHMCKQVVM
jgi:hypothetical protein